MIIIIIIIIIIIYKQKKKKFLFILLKMKPTELTCNIYEETLNCKKDLHLSIKLDEFDPSRPALLKDDLNNENYNIFYDGKKFRLFVEKLYGKVKTSRVFENDYLSFKDDQTKAKK